MTHLFGPATKFACLSLHALADHALTVLTERLPGGFLLEPKPDNLNLSDWAEHMGRSRLSDIEDANIWVWVTCDSGRFDVLDHENDALAERLQTLVRGVLMNRPGWIESAWIATGSLRDGVPHVATLHSVDAWYHKEPLQHLTLEKLRSAASIAECLEREFGSGSFTGRCERGLTAFFSAMRSPWLDESIMHLERALEGLFHPASAKQFVRRAAACCSVMGYSQAERETLLQRLYDVRSEFTHAAPVDVVFKGATFDNAQLEARRLQTFAYLFAAHAYQAVLANSSLVAKLNPEGTGPYWGKVVEGKVAPPFTVQLDPNNWGYGLDAEWGS